MVVLPMTKCLIRKPSMAERPPDKHRPRRPNSQNMTTDCAENDGDLDGFGTHDSCEVIDCDDGNPSISPASFEACNGLDDDCDGESDEGLGQRRCGMGECSIRIDNCIAGEISICPEGVGQPESCNGLDDCDAVDEEIAQLTCGTGAVLRMQCASTASRPSAAQASQPKRCATPR